jgi:uncharacterized protein
MEFVGWGLILVLFICAYVGLVVPFLPDVLLVFAGFLVYHFFIDPHRLDWTFWLPMGLITLLMFILDYVASAIAAKKYGGSKGSMWAALIGMVLFPFIIGPLGVIVGPFLLVFLVEIGLKRNIKAALKIGWSTVIGFVSGLFVKFFAIAGMEGWFLYLVLRS